MNQWPTAQLSVPPIAPPLPTQTVFLRKLATQAHFSPHFILFPSFMSASAALPLSFSPYIRRCRKAARSDSAYLSFPLCLALALSLFPVNRHPLVPAVLSVSLWPLDLFLFIWAVLRLAFCPRAGVLMHPVTPFPYKYCIRRNVGYSVLPFGLTKHLVMI